jgi:hypothetical protein
VPSDNSKESIAFFDTGSLGFFSKSRPPMLCIAPEGMRIIDEIVATFIYARQDIERRRRRQRANGGMMGSSGGGGGSVGGSSSF